MPRLLGLSSWDQPVQVLVLIVACRRCHRSPVVVTPTSSIRPSALRSAAADAQPVVADVIQGPQVVVAAGVMVADVVAVVLVGVGAVAAAVPVWKRSTMLWLALMPNRASSPFALGVAFTTEPMVKLPGGLVL